jgi:uncharacterized protein
VRRRDKEITDPRAILDVLLRGEVLRLAMIDEDGAPYLVPLSYVARPARPAAPLSGLTLLVHSALEGKKIAALRRDPRVCFEVTVDVAIVPAQHARNATMRFRSVIGRGRAAFVSDRRAKLRALGAIADRYVPGAPVGEEDGDRVAIIEIAVDSLSCKESPPPAR